LCMPIGLLNTELNYGLLETENHASNFYGVHSDWKTGNMRVLRRWPVIEE
jgi:hypothetical protein